MAKIQYAVDVKANPRRLARLTARTSETITPDAPKWTTDLYYLDWLYTSDGDWITTAEAKAIAEKWGARLPE
jgi:hypothetical protein